MKRFAVILITCCLVAASIAAGAAEWESFVIRASSGGVQPVITDNPDGSKTFATVLDGQKAGWGTNSINGRRIGDILSISIERDPSVTGWGPYMNFWITDGNGRYAVIANEPSNVGEWTSGSTAYNATWDVLKNATAKVYETNGLPFTLPAGTAYKFGDFADYIIATPLSHWGGTGAPDDMNAPEYTAYGVNWVFGDSMNNYVGVYTVSNPSVQVAQAAVPEPMSILLGAMGLGSIAGFRRLRAK